MNPSNALRCLSAILAGGLLLSCAPRQTVRWEPGIALAGSTGSISPATPPRTVRIENKVRLRAQGRVMNFETVVVADSIRGRLEALGPFGMPLATLVWRDTSWQVWLPSQGALVEGNGDSFTLPVVGLRTFRPRELVAPYLGRTLHAPSGTPLRKVGGDRNTALFLPIQPEPEWAIAIDRRTGLPQYRQILRKGSESERFRFGAWSLREGVPVPDSIVRTGRDSQEVVLRLASWESVASLPTSTFQIDLGKPVDTIRVVRDGFGRRRYSVHPAGGRGNAPAAESLVDTLTDIEESSPDISAEDDSLTAPDEDLAEDEEILPGE